MLIGSLVEWHVGFYSCLCFSSRKIVLKSLLDASLIASYLSSFLSFFLSQSRQLLDTWWIDRESSCLFDSFSTPGGSIENFLVFCWFVPRQILNTCICRHLLCSTPVSPSLNQSRSSWMHYFSHDLRFFIIFVSIASCFSFSCRSMAPCSPCSLYVYFLIVSVMSFGFLCPLTIMSKRGRNLRIECHSSWGVIDLGGRTSC